MNELIARRLTGSLDWEVDVFRGFVWHKVYLDWWRVPPYQPCGGSVWYFNFPEWGHIRAADLMWRVWAGEWIGKYDEFVFINGNTWDIRIRNLSIERSRAPRHSSALVRRLYFEEDWGWRDLMSEFHVNSTQLRALLIGDGSSPFRLKGKRSRRVHGEVHLHKQVP